MPPVPDPSSTPEVVSSLESGLAALKQGDYATAIGQLESISLPPEHPLGAKAQMGLVLAYTRAGNPETAASLCQTLTESSNAQVQEWAQRTLSDLITRYPQVAASLETGAPEEDKLHNSGATEIQNVADPEVDRAPSPDNSLPEASGSSNPTGFVPLSSSDQPQPSRSTTNSRRVRLPRSARERPISVTNGTPLGAGSVSAEKPAMEMPQPRPAEPLTSEASKPVVPYIPVWRQAERAKQWQPLGKVNLIPLLLLQMGTAVSLFWLVQTITHQAAIAYVTVLSRIPFLNFRSSVFGPAVWSVLILLVVLGVASRWLLDGLLTVCYGMQPLSLGKLATYSPETARVLQRFCRQQKIPMPTLGILPTAAPIAFSYGCLPRVARTVISQGLLDQLTDDEIAAIYACEVGHIAYRTLPLMSLVMVLMQIPYTQYWVIAEWGNRSQAAFLKAIATVLASGSYGLYALLRWIALWLSRQRIHYSDRIAVELTGNPNGLTRALLKSAIGIANEVKAQGKTSYLLKGFDLLTPLGQQAAIVLGSIYPHTPLEPVLEWDRRSPYRHWLSLNQSHPPIGDRLTQLMRYAQRWKLATELNLDSAQPLSNNSSQGGKLSGRQWRTLLLQGAPFLGLVFGLVIAFVLSITGWIGLRLDIPQLYWMYDNPPLFQALPWIGFSLGTVIRFNPFFPDIQFSERQSPEVSPALTELLKDPAAIPVDSLPIRLEGKLLGRSGIGNLLSQDLLLQTATGIVRLHCLSQFGPLGNLLPQDVRPIDLLNQNITVIGWFRRGAVPWIDVETLRTSGGRVSRSGHPVWSAILAAIAAVWGLYLITRYG